MKADIFFIRTAVLRNWSAALTAMIDDMAALSLRVLAESGHTLDEVASVGIGIPGMLDPRTGRVPFCTNLKWHDVPLMEMMRARIDKPIFANNDATVAGLAEHVAGVCRGAKNSVVVTLGTGVGGGVVLDGKVFMGPHGVATEVGHMITVAGRRDVHLRQPRLLGALCQRHSHHPRGP